MTETQLGKKRPIKQAPVTTEAEPALEDKPKKSATGWSPSAWKSGKKG